MSKKILFGNDARQRIKKGIDKCCDVVKVSLGNNGKNVLIYNGQTTEIINDGVSIAREVNVKDEIEQAGIQLAKQCANQTNEDAGDGTTTTLVLLQSILKEIITEFQTENPRELRNRLFREANEVLSKVEVGQIKTKEDIYNLALTSSLNPDVAKIISEIYDELGKDAQVSIEETSRNVLEKEILKGIKFESKRAESRILRTNEKIVLEDCNVLVKDKIESPADIQVAVAMMAEKKDLVVISNSFSRQVLLHIMGAQNINIYPIEYKMFAPIDDIQDYVGGELVGKVIIEQDNTTLIGGKGDVKKKVAELKEKIAKEESQYEKENLEKRIANVLGKVAIIRVGKNTDVERIEAVLKIEDALGTVKGAYEMGYCLGAGRALGMAAENASDTMKTICASPMIQLLDNAGVKKLDKLENVIDSFKTVKYSLLNALSTATSILTAEVALIEENDSEA